MGGLCLLEEGEGGEAVPCLGRARAVRDVEKGRRGAVPYVGKGEGGLDGGEGEGGLCRM